MKDEMSIFLVGPMGAGKSSIGKLLASQLQLDFFDSDYEIERRAGTSISWIFDVEGEEGFRKREIKVIDDLTQMKNIVLATGGGSIVTPENREVLAKRGKVIYLQASIDQLVKRTEKNLGHRPLLRVANPKARIIELQKIREPLYESIADFTLATDRYSTPLITEKIIEFIRS